MSYSTTHSTTYTTTDIETVIRRLSADLEMIAASTAAVSEEHARKWAHDIEVLAKNDYLNFVDLTLLHNNRELKATRFYVDESGDLTNDRPGNARWPKVDGAELRITLNPKSSYDQTAREKIAGKLKFSWTKSYSDISHSTLTQTNGREYSSNGYGIQRKDYN